MNRDEAREMVKTKLEDYLRQRGINTRKPFNCLNPAHADHNPSMSFDRKHNRVKCFSCGATYDIFDLVGLDYGLTDSKAIFDKAYDLYGLTVEDKPRRSTPGEEFKTVENRKEAKNRQHTDTNADVYTHKAGAPESAKFDFREAIEAAHKALIDNPEAMAHYTSRGITQAIIDGYMLGYTAEGHNSLLQAYPEIQTKSPKAYLYRYVLPFIDEDGGYSYFQTEIADRQQIDKYNGKYRKINIITAPIFNERYLKKDTPAVVFVTEGLYDAYSVEIAGGKAVALQGGGGDNRFIALCKKHKPEAVFVLYTDIDEAGEDYVKRITEALEALSIAYVKKKPQSGKDANEELVSDKEAFTERIQQIIAEAMATKKQAEEEAKQAYLATSAGANLQPFINGITESVNTEALPTGFATLDDVLDGGLYEGLYAIGAISSLGKTTFIQQIGDQIAQTGHDVVIFSLEMARSEMMAKSISRHTLEIALSKGLDARHAKTQRGITSGKRYVNYSRTEVDLISDAITAYGEYADHVFIVEGVGDIGVEQIRGTIEKHIRFTGNKPLVIVDYLQIIAPYNERATDKQATDKAVLELKRISRDYKLPVIAISSFNRTGYKESVTFESLKESGAIEYSCDVVIGLQLKGAGGKDFNPTEEKRKDPRQVEAVILKNRQGKVGDKLYFSYYPMFNYFKDMGLSN